MIGGYSGMVKVMSMMYDYEKRLASITGPNESRRKKMMQCSTDKELTWPDGSYRHEICVNEAEIFALNDPCSGLCAMCAYQKTKAMLAEKDQMIEALSGDIILLQAQKDENKEHKY